MKNKLSYLSSLISHLSSRQGFTLIELLWSVAITAMLSAVGIAAFFTFSRMQVLNNAASEFATTLNTAKSLTQSQAEPASKRPCVGSLPSSYIFDGYKVTIIDPSTYKLEAQYTPSAGSSKCVSTILDQKGNPTRKLPDGVTFGSSPSFFFPVLSGGVTITGVSTVTLTGILGTSKTISVSPSGLITSN